MRSHAIVASESGYNRDAESLRPVESPFAVEGKGIAPAIPLASGASDSFRMVFLRDEIKPFVSYRVRIAKTVTDKP